MDRTKKIVRIARSRKTWKLFVVMLFVNTMLRVRGHNFTECRGKDAHSGVIRSKIFYYEI